MVAWGHKGALLESVARTTPYSLDFGGDISEVQSQLRQVKAIYSTYSAFTAVLNDGNVVTWGDRGPLLN